MSANGNRATVLQPMVFGAAGSDHLRSAVPAIIQCALRGVTAAEDALAAGEIARKGELVDEVLRLLEQLRGHLHGHWCGNRGGRRAANLDALYRYMNRRLLDCAAGEGGAALVEVASLLRELQSGWHAIAASLNGEDDLDDRQDELM